MTDIAVNVTNMSVPVNGLTDDPEITIRRIDTGAVVVGPSAMTDQGADGLYTFQFLPPSLVIGRGYSFLIDADPNATVQVTAFERFYNGAFAELDTPYLQGIWVDTTGGGTAGSTPGVNGVQSNPVDNEADAIALSVATGINWFKLKGNFTIPVATPLPFYQFEAVAGGGTLDPNGNDVGGSIFIRVGLTGTMLATSGAMFGFQTSLLGPSSGFVGVLVDPGLTGTITLGAGTTTIANGASIVPGTSTPVLDLNGVASLNLRNYSGGIDIRGSSAGGQNSSIEISQGQVLIGDASNTAGVFAIRGWPDIIGLPGAGVTVNLAAYGPVLVDEELTAQHGAGSWAGIAATQQDIRDAMKLAPTAGAPAAGSVDEHLDDILNDTATIEPIVSANLDVAVSTRNSVVPLDAATDAAAHIATQNAIGALNDISIADVQTALDNQGYTAARAVLLDNLDAAISTRAAPGDAMGLTAATLTAIQGLILSDATPFQGGDIALILTAAVDLASFIEGGREIDFVGSDTNGWQRVERNVAGSIIRRYNLFDETDTRINETVASFIGRQGMISRETIV